MHIQMRYAAIAGLFAGTMLCFGAASSRLLWQGESGGYLIQWSTANLTAESGGKTTLNLAAWARGEWTKILRDWKATSQEPFHGEYCEIDFDYDLLSVVGPVVSTKEFDGSDCGGAHPSEYSQFKAFNLSKSTPAKPAPTLLTDWFAPDDILKAFLNDPVMKKVLPPDRHIASLREFIDVVKYQPIKLEKDSCDFTISSDVLENFAFYDYDGRNVSVRVSLSQYQEPCHGIMTQAGIVLPAPATLRKSLTDAKAHRVGFLMKGRPVIGTYGRETSLVFAEPPVQ